MALLVRKPAVAGQFYSAEPERLLQQVERYLVPGSTKQKCIGIVSPHAGLMYSGPVAGAVYSSVELTDTVLLLGPNHTGMGERASVMGSGEWTIPTGTFQIDTDFAAALVSRTPIISESSSAHLYEHSLEVQLPFIGYFRSDVRIVPVTIMQLSLEECFEIGRGIAETIQSRRQEVLIIASSDMSHYVTDETARKKDSLAIERILSIDPEGLYSVVHDHAISMCGYIPATIMLVAARVLGASSAELVRYATSGEVSGDYRQVVGYAGILVR
ncbi:MAG: AmmeMemoRadiSam system protein B [bacterium]